MGIYKNKKMAAYINQSIQKNEASSNQKMFKRSYLHELLEEQKGINQSLANSLLEVNQSIEHSRQAQSKQIEKVIGKLSTHEEIAGGLHHYFKEQEKTNEMMMNRLIQLEKTNKVLVEKLEADGLLTQAFLEQQARQEKKLETISEKLLSESALDEKLAQAEKVYTDLSEKLGLQEVFHNTVMERLDQQEGLVKRLINEVDHLRSIIYERAADLQEKFESNMHRITRPIQRFFIQTDEKDKVN